MKRQERITMQRIVFLLTISIMLSCGSGFEMPKQQPPDVVVGVPQMKTMPNLWEYPGYTQSEQTVDLVARVSGFLDKVAYNPGDFVQKGQLLFVIEPKTYVDNVTEAEQNVKNAEVTLQLSQVTYEKTLEAAKSNAISEIDLLQTKTNLEQAKVALTNAETQLDLARNTLSYCYIRAPFSGRVSKNSVDVGNYINAATSPKTLATIYKDDNIYVNFSIEEYRYITLKQMNKKGNYKVFVTFTDKENNNYVREGIIDYTAPNVDLSTGTLSMRAILKNPENKIKSGMFVKINLLIDTLQNVIAIPESSIGTDQAGRYVFIVDDSNRVTKRQINVGILDAQNYRQILGGLTRDERYVQTGLVKVHEGQTIHPVTAREK